MCVCVRAWERDAARAMTCMRDGVPQRCIAVGLERREKRCGTSGSTHTTDLHTSTHTQTQTERRSREKKAITHSTFRTHTHTQIYRGTGGRKKRKKTRGEARTEVVRAKVREIELFNYPVAAQCELHVRGRTQRRTHVRARKRKACCRPAMPIPAAHSDAKAKTEQMKSRAARHSTSVT